jgi:phosphohistidine phosphatase
MKTLLLLRHAKSSWSHPALNDHDRPLKKRGLKAAPRMGAVMREHGLRPDLVLCSTALRAQETWKLVQPELPDGQFIPLTLSADLYHCQPAQFFSALSNVTEPTDSVLVIGHNPDLESFVTELTGESHRLPTAALIKLELPLDVWSQLNETTRASVASVWRPRELV